MASTRTRRPVTTPRPIASSRPIDSITPDPANLRRHNERSLAAVAASLARFGQQKPIVIDRKGVVIAGHGVLGAARRLGWKQVAVIESRLGGVERIAYGIADNRTAELSEWDEGALIATLREMDATLQSVTGFDVDDLADLGLHPTRTAAEDDVPDPLPKAVTRAGDLWLLGEHRLLCGSSLVQADVDRVLGGEKAALISTDPPYLVDYTGKRMGGRGKDWSESYREVEIKDSAAFFGALMAIVAGALSPHAAVYCWHASSRAGEIRSAGEASGLLWHQMIVWVKPTAVFGTSMYQWQHEPCMMGWKQGSKPRHDGRQDVSSVWVVPWNASTNIESSLDSDAWFVDWEGRKRVVGNEHPTQKPVELFARPMRKHTKPGDLCFEPFSGSGSQLIAGEQLGRRVAAIELEPVFVDVAIRRWQEFTGKKATLEGDGRDWPSIAFEREVPIDGNPHVDAQVNAAASSSSAAAGDRESPPPATAPASRRARGKTRARSSRRSGPPADPSPR